MGGVPTALRSREVDPRRKHVIEYLPWARQYRFTVVDTGVKFRLHEHRIDWAQTVEEWQEAHPDPAVAKATA